jgi:nucleoside-diphosphate-sugar epimerase
MKVLITGGSGFLGVNLIRSLSPKGYSLVSLDIADGEREDAGNFNFIKGDIRDREAVDRAVSGCNIVIHAAAALPLYKKEDIFSTDIDGTRNVLESSLKHKVDRVIHVSSTAVYGIPDHHPIYENDRMEGVGPYGEAKIKAEELCLEYRKKGLCVAILRPKSFIGPERLGVFALLYDWAKDGRGFPVIGNGGNRYQLLDVDDLCEAIYLCMTKDRKAVNDTFNIGAKVFSTMKEDFQSVLDAAGFNKKIVALPAWPAITALKILEALRISPLYKWVYETASKDSFVSIEKAQRILGFDPKYSNRDSLVRNFRWYVDNIDKAGRKSGVSHRVPWEQGILNLFKLFF